MKRRWLGAGLGILVLFAAAGAGAFNPQPDPHGELTEFLLSHQIRYARASYWDSYIVDFLSRERVIVASNGPVRIPECMAGVGPTTAGVA